MPSLLTGSLFSDSRHAEDGIQHIKDTYPTARRRARPIIPIIPAVRRPRNAVFFPSRSCSGGKGSRDRGVKRYVLSDYLWSACYPRPEDMTSRASVWWLRTRDIILGSGSERDRRYSWAVVFPLTRQRRTVYSPLSVKDGALRRYCAGSGGILGIGLDVWWYR